MDQPWETECLPFNETATGWLGEQRDTMLTNELLRKPPLGRAKVRGLPIPKPEYVYGYMERGQWKMKDALQGWPGCNPEQDPLLAPLKFDTRTKDFRQINRSAVLQGIVDAKSWRSYVKSHYAAPIDPKESKRASVKAGISERPPPAIPPKDMAHGHQNPPHEPMKMILSNAYQDGWMMKTKLKDTHMKDLKEKQIIKVSKKPNYRQWYPSKASMLRTFMPPIGVTSPPWRMPRFLKKAKPHLCTFPSEKVKLASIQANAFDHVGHQGSMGQGIITVATNHKAALESTRLERGCRVCPRIQ